MRDASGLVREMGTRDAFTVGISQVNMATALTVMVSGLALFPRSDLLVPMVIAAVMTIFLAVVYAQLTATMPRSGGDYIFISRILNPVLGAVIGVAVLWFTVIAVGENALLFGQLFWPFLLTTLGSALHISGLTTFGHTVSSTHGWQFAFGTASILVAVVVACLSVRAIAKSSFWMIVFGTVAFLVVVGEFAFNGGSAFQHAFNAASGGKDAYHGVITAAAKNGIPHGVAFSATASAVSLMVLIWFGTTYPAITGGELKRPGRTMLRGQLWTIGISIVTLAIGYEVIKHALGFTFFQASSGLSTNDPTVYSHLTGVADFVPSYAVLIMSDPVSKIFIAFGLPAFNLALVIISLFVGSRMIFALSFDRLLPARLASVESRRNAPVWAAVVMAVLSTAFLAAYVFSSDIASAFRNTVLILATDFAVVALAGVLLPFIKKGLWDSSPKVVTGEFLGIPLFSYISFVAFVLFGFVVYLAASKSQVSGGYDTASLVTLAASPIVGVVIYIVARGVTRHRGIDLRLAMHELPPD
ncbi:MAG: APC family permease [Solirubrobacteraceae bacterium]